MAARETPAAEVKGGKETVARYTVSIKENKNGTSRVFETDGIIGAYLTGRGAAGFNQSQNRVETAKILIALNAICEKTFERDPKLKRMVQEVTKHISKEEFYEL